MRRALWVLALLYLVIAVSSVPIDVERIADGGPRALRFILAFLSPDFRAHGEDIWRGITESLAMALVGTAAGALLSLPLALGAAVNLVPAILARTCRGAIAAARSLHEIVIAILFVVMVGFGPLAGALTLTFASAGFLAKLLSEAIEAIDPRPLEALRAAGARPLQVVLFAVVPQVAPRIIGLTAYRLDINFRESAILGVVGAGGIGATLQTAFARYEFDTAAAVLWIVIAIVLAAELLSQRLRASLT